MKVYFLIQYKMMNRRLSDLGFQPLWGYLLFSITFIALSFYLFYKTDYSEYLYILIFLFFLSKLSEIKRNDFLNTIFKKKDYHKIRFIENILIAIPFIAFLLVKNYYVSSFIMLVLSIIFVFINFRTDYNWTIPSPFSKRPFEFSVGFRSTFFLYPLAYLLTIISIAVDNFNLGGFSLLFVFLIILSYYNKLEEEYFVWNFKHHPKRFLLVKIKEALLYATLVILPIILALSIFFWKDIYYLIALLSLGYAYLICIISAKYSNYPSKIGLLAAFILGISLTFPPIVIIMIPFFIAQSIQKLKILK